jgi:hypothetical protein
MLMVGLTGGIGAGKSTVAAQHRIAQHAAATLTDTLYPIPLTEIQLDPSLTQNPGW